MGNACGSVRQLIFESPPFEVCNWPTGLGSGAVLRQEDGCRSTSQVLERPQSDQQLYFADDRPNDRNGRTLLLQTRGWTTVRPRTAAPHVEPYT